MGENGSARSGGIEVEALVREFKNGPRAVDGIDLEVAQGEIYGFLGPNGAGKSTTVLMLTTLLPPTAGTARVAGFDVVAEGPQVRATIGAALQEAALDPLLTGREHMRLQTAMHGLGKAERAARGTELLDRVGLSDAADRKVGGYSGGMKRRLDLALALAHRPRILFLDEPTTGLDIQSRTALWEEVARLAAEDGVTVFLTTQYLEEADALADRVGIIDHGHLVAEGTPAALKAEIGRPTVEAVPREAGDRERMTAVLGRFGERAGSSPRGVAVRLDGGESQLAEVVRALDSEGIAIEHLQLHAPSLDDVFLAKTGRSLEGAERGGAGGRRRRGGRTRMSGSLRTQVGQLAHRSVLRTLRQPAQIVPALVFPLFLLAVNAGGLKDATNLPGFPTDSYLTFILAVPFMQGALFSVMNAGTDLARDIETGFLNRLALTPLRGAALLSGLLAGAVRARPRAGDRLPRGRADRRRRPGGGSGRRPGHRRPLGLDHRRLRHDRPLRRAAHRLRRGGPGPLPGLLRLPLPLGDGAAARPADHRLVPHDRHASTRSPTCCRRSARC